MTTRTSWPLRKVGRWWGALFVSLALGCGGDGGASAPDAFVSDTASDVDEADADSRRDTGAPDAGNDVGPTDDVTLDSGDVLDEDIADGDAAVEDVGTDVPLDTVADTRFDVEAHDGDVSPSDAADALDDPALDSGSDADVVLDADASTDVDADVGCEENACGGCDVLEWEGAAGEPGDACESICGSSELVCDGDDALRCEAVPANECGGCSDLDPAPGTPCSAATDELGVFLCTGPDAVACFDASTNRCGGTSALDAIPGSSCGECLTGTWACDGIDSIVCVESATPTNSCGGCGPLEAEPGSECDECGGVWTCGDDGRVFCESGQTPCGGCTELEGEPGSACAEGALWVCAGDDEVSCVDGALGGCDPAVVEPAPLGSSCGPCDDGRVQCAGGLSACVAASAPNVCGGCGFVPGAPGDRCAPGAEYTCEEGDLVCSTSPLPAGEPCVEDGDCASGFCTEVSFESERRYCAEFCDPEGDDLCADGSLCYALQTEDPAPCVELCAGLEGIELLTCYSTCASPSVNACLPESLCVDEDGDGYGVAGGCLIDCDDSNPGANLGAPEVCDGIDNDCDGLIDEIEDGELGCGLIERCAPTGCYAVELCADGVDNDADGDADCLDSDCDGTSACAGDGACTGDSDLFIISELEVGGALASCLFECIGSDDSPACIAACTSDATELTSECGACLDAHADCFVAGCAEECATPEAECGFCFATCQDEFTICAGLDSVTPCINSDQPCSGPHDDTEDFVCDEVHLVCRRRCDETEMCPREEGCRPPEEFSDPSRLDSGVCLPPSCGSTADDTVCADDETCLITGSASFCEPAGEGIIGESCEDDLACGAGLLCFLNRCVAPCDSRTGGGGVCDDDTTCIPVFESSLGNRPGICGRSCPNYSSGACGDNEVCVPNRDEGSALMAFTCQSVPEGVPSAGESCDPSLGCAEGSLCRPRIEEGFECVEFCSTTDVPGDFVGCPDGDRCLRTGPRTLGTCTADCAPFPRDGECGDGLTCLPVTESGRYTPDAGACVIDELADAPGEGEPCTPDGGCSALGVCFGSDDAAVCRAICDPLADTDTCGDGLQCAFAPGASTTPAAGVCLPGSDPASAGEACMEASGTPCGHGGICLEAFAPGVTTCVQPCVLGGTATCPGGAICEELFDWDGRPYDLGTCPVTLP